MSEVIAEGFWQSPGRVRSIEWYTPPWVFKALGLEFDLDPCHPAERLPWVPAKRTIDRLENGLLQPWRGRVWLNPPYGKETGQWCARLADHGNGIALVFARTDCAWFHDAIAKAGAVLFLRGRIVFVDGSGTGKAGAGAGSLMAAWGTECVDALGRLSDRGWLVTNQNHGHQSNRPITGARGIMSTESARLCTDYGQPCPAGKRGKFSRCEENGICQRVNMDTLPKVKFVDGSLVIEPHAMFNEAEK